jgi:uncharacterized membrane protein
MPIEGPWTGNEAQKRGETTIGLSQNETAALTYLVPFPPLFGLGLYFVERQNKYIRFHAMQSILFGVVLAVTSIGIVVLMWLLWGLSVFLAGIVGFTTMLGMTGAWCFLMWQAYTGERYELPGIGKMAATNAKRR